MFGGSVFWELVGSSWDLGVHCAGPGVAQDESCARRTFSVCRRRALSPPKQQAAGKQQQGTAAGSTVLTPPQHAVAAEAAGSKQAAAKHSGQQQQQQQQHSTTTLHTTFLRQGATRAPEWSKPMLLYMQ